MVDEENEMPPVGSKYHPAQDLDADAIEETESAQDAIEAAESADDTWRAAETEPPPAMPATDVSTTVDVSRDTAFDSAVQSLDRILRARAALELFCAQHPTLAPLVSEIRRALA
jgi:hypothetical protein